VLLGAAAVSSRDWRRMPDGRSDVHQILVHHEGKGTIRRLARRGGILRNEVMTR
jgi:hypothetical protein